MDVCARGSQVVVQMTPRELLLLIATGRTSRLDPNLDPDVVCVRSTLHPIATAAWLASAISSADLPRYVPISSIGPRVDPASS